MHFDKYRFRLDTVGTFAVSVDGKEQRTEGSHLIYKIQFSDISLLNCVAFA